MFGKKRVKDPICGMMVDPKTAISRNIGGATYYFCSENCANEFEESKSSEHHGSHSGHGSHEGHNCGC